MNLGYNAYLTRSGAYHFAHFDLSIVTTEIPLLGFTRLGVLFQPVCASGAKYPVVLLEFDPVLRDYILLSQTFPSQLPPLPPATATWSVTNLQGPDFLTFIDLLLTLPDNSGDISCKTTQTGSDLFLGVSTPEEFGVSLSLSGTVLGSIYVNFPTPSPPSPVFPPLPPPPIYDNILVDGSFPPDFEYPPGFLWPSQVNTFYPWFYIMYSGDPLPPLEELPYIPTEIIP